MNKGVKLRLTIHNILFEIFKFNKNLDNSSINNIINIHNKRDISFIYNICLNSMRYQFHSKKIINLYTRKKQKVHELLLLNSAITQIVFLNLKDYAVINSSVDIAKKLKIYHGYINAILKKIAIDKKKLKNIKITYNDLPKWFKLKTKYLSSSEKNSFLDNLTCEPSLHLVFKNKKKLIEFEKSIYFTSDVSGFVKERVELEKLSSFKKGYFWVQDFSSAMPLNNIPNKVLNNKLIDLCSAPGGKAFQILSKNKNIVLNDINKRRIRLLNTNLKRLKFKAEIKNQDILNMNNKEKYDFIILDAPCSAVGTIRKNPEIFFKSLEPDLNNLKTLQEKMLEKASILLNKNGIILYMVCSFLKVETVEQIDKFLLKNNNFILNEFYLSNENIKYKDLIKDKYMLTLPTNLNNYTIDGYFAAFLKKKD